MLGLWCGYCGYRSRGLNRDSVYLEWGLSEGYGGVKVGRW